MSCSRIFFPFFIAALLLSSCNCRTINGAASLKDQSFDEPLTVNGALDGQNLQFKGLTVNGAVTLENATIDGDLDVRGSLSLKNSTVKGSTKISGSGNFVSSQFLGDIDAKGALSLKDSKSKNIAILSSRERVDVRLEGTSIVDGKISFANNNGVVSISSGTSIKEGISGGTLEKGKDVKNVGPIKNGVEVP